jgi:KUP system potassium uptake protein
MTATTIAYFVVLDRTWRWPRYKSVLLCLFFLIVDLTFLTANLRKFADGGWVPFCIGTGVFTLFTTWMTGRARLAAHLRSAMLPMDLLLKDIANRPPPRVKGCAVFLTGECGRSTCPAAPSLQAQPGAA